MNDDMLRTPDSDFAGLPDYPFAAHYIEVDGVRIHYVDEGARSAPLVFLLHGQPAWSYMYRHMIPPLVAAGCRVIAPDLVGFGKSDKPRDPGACTYGAHVQWMSGFVRALGVTGAAAFMQDWGGPIGLRVLAENPTWLSRLVLANTVMAGAGPIDRMVMPLGIRVLTALSGRPDIDTVERTLSFRHWLGYFQRSPTLEIGRLVQALTVRDLGPAEVAAYDAPYPDPSYGVAVRRMPTLVGTELTAVHRAWQVLTKWPHPALMLFSDRDPFVSGTPFEQMFRDRLPGAAGQPHHTITNASHFLQEDAAPELVKRIVDWLAATGFGQSRAA